MRFLTTKSSAALPDFDKDLWAATFRNEFENFSEATIFMSRCIYIAFSHILASRKLMPESVFKKTTIDGNLRAYVTDSSEILGARLLKKFKGVAEAIEQRYLRELNLVVSPTEEDWSDAIEMYTWRMHYNADGEPQAELQQSDGTVVPALRFKGDQFVKKQTTELLKSLSSLFSCILNPLPVGASATMRITYTDRTPKGYQAPGFYRSPEDPVLRRHAHSFKLGLFQTKYHRASVRVRSAFLNCGDIMKMSFNEGIELYNLDGADGGAHRSVNSNSVKRMSSGRPLQQNETVEAADEDVVFIGETRAPSSFGIPGWDSSELTRPNFNSSERRSFAEDYSRRLRRGRHTLTKRSRGQSVHGRFGGPASATPQVVNASTTQSKDRDITRRTQPARKTRVGTSCELVTPNEPRARRRK